MSKLIIDLPPVLADWVERQTASGAFVDAGDYVRALLRREAERSAKIATMDRLVEEGLASGVATESVEAIFDQVRKPAN